jgi:hypothetical protein
LIKQEDLTFEHVRSPVFIIIYVWLWVSTPEPDIPLVIALYINSFSKSMRIELINSDTTSIVAPMKMYEIISFFCFHKWACQRFLCDIEREGKDEFPYVFDIVLFMIFVLSIVISH